MTQEEWEQSHPSQCEAYENAWKEKLKREEILNASIRLTIAQTVDGKIGGRKVTLNDFLPPFARIKAREISPEEQEQRLKQKLQFMAAAHARKANGKS